MNAETRALLEVVLDAIKLPAPATVGDDEAFTRLLEARVLDAVVFLEGVLNDSFAESLGYDWYVTYLRKQIASNPPTTYRHYQECDGGEQG